MSNRSVWVKGVVLRTVEEQSAGLPPGALIIDPARVVLPKAPAPESIDTKGRNIPAGVPAEPLRVPALREGGLTVRDIIGWVMVRYDGLRLVAEGEIEALALPGYFAFGGYNPGNDQVVLTLVTVNRESLDSGQTPIEVRQEGLHPAWA